VIAIDGKKFLTIADMAKALNIQPNTVKQRLFQAKIKPVSKDAIYEESALDAIRVAPMGRPRKKPAEPEAKAKSTKAEK
jgi:hypothetical protein